MRRLALTLPILSAALVLGACSARTTGVTDINDGAATLHAAVSCDAGESCRWYWQFWPQGQPRAGYQATATYGPVTGPTGVLNISTRITGLHASSTYLWVLCGSVNGSSFLCAGPHGTFSPVTDDPPADYSTLTTTAPGTLAERWNTTGWHLQTSANPPGALRSSLAGVSCNLGRTCTAVGSYFVSPGFGRALAEHWSGGKWTLDPTPNPAGTDDAELLAVSCTAANACTAVGGYNNAGISDPLAERWNGSSWAIQTTPVPSGSFSSTLRGVSCTSTTACVAVGSYNPSGTVLPLIERWDGSSWTLQSMPTPPGATFVYLNGVSCTADTACTAVGSYGTGGPSQPLAERWNGTSWTIQSVPSTSRLNSTVLNGVSCSAATSCVAVGEGSANQTLAEHWDGTAWTVKPTPNPSFAKYGSSLSGVSCTSPSACTAVGSPWAVALRWDGTSWTQQTLADPGDSPNPVSVSCPSLRHCTAVGGQ